MVAYLCKVSPAGQLLTLCSCSGCCGSGSSLRAVQISIHTWVRQVRCMVGRMLLVMQQGWHGVADLLMVLLLVVIEWQGGVVYGPG